MNSDAAGVEKVESLEAGQRILCGNQWVRVSTELADAFQPGDSLIALQEMGELLRITAADLKIADTAVTEAASAFTALARASDEQISLFYKKFAEFLSDKDLFHYVQVANNEDVESALKKGRSVTRLRIDEKMRSDMVEGLLMWSRLDLARDLVMSTVEHDGWNVEVVRAPLGVVGFVFEGRPNVFADATGVLRTGNTVVFRIGEFAWNRRGLDDSWSIGTRRRHCIFRYELFRPQGVQHAECCCNDKRCSCAQYSSCFRGCFSGGESSECSSNCSCTSRFKGLSRQL